MLSPRRFAFVPAALIVGALCAGIAGADSATPPPPTPGPNACDRDTLAAVVLAHHPTLGDSAATSIDPSLLTIRCVDVNGDGVADAVWTLASGGSGGAFFAGVTTSGSGSAPATIVAWIDTHDHLVTGTYRGKPAIGWPRYRKGDPNCCSTGGWGWRTFTAGPGGTVHTSKVHKSARNAPPLKHIA